MPLFNLQRTFTIACLNVSLLLTGCITHKMDDAPGLSVAPHDSFSVQSNGADLNTPWWQSLARPELNTLIETSLNHNFDVAQAVAVLAQSQAVQRVTSSQRLPQLGLEADAGQTWAGSDDQRGSSSAQLALGWELDIWNRLGNAARSDRLEAAARQADVDAVKLSLSAEVAQAYFGAVAAQQRLELLRNQLELDQELENILQLRLDGGVGTTVDLLQQQAQVTDSAALIPLAQAELSTFENRLDVLLGNVPDAAARIDVDTLTFTTDLPAISVPAALLVNRPDLVAAQAELAAADADIAAAIADRLPALRLTGSTGVTDSATLNGPVSALMASFVQPLLDWGQRRAEVARNKALYQERLAAYTQLYLEAVEDVENALVQEQRQREFLTKLSAQVDILQRAFTAAEQRYTQGVDDYQPVITALRTLRATQRQVITAQQDLLTQRINLFRALGGPIAATYGNQKSQTTLLLAE